MRSLPNAVAGLEPGAVRGLFQRHSSPKVRGLRASTGGGRWGPEHGYPVLYLGRPEASIVVEAHRSLVEGVEGMRPDLVGPRQLHTVDVAITNLLDLRIPANVEAVGLDGDALAGPWAPCARVGSAAHRLGLHGIIAPAATGIGETLALFETNVVAAGEWPEIVDTAMWSTLPPDPRRLRLISETGTDG